MPRQPYTPEQVLAAFWAKVDRHDPEGCWLWTGGVTSGRVTYGQYRSGLAHRYAYAVVGGHRIPAGYEVEHLCHNGLCVRPDHLRAVTHADNERAKDAAGRRPRGIKGLPCPHCGGPQDGRSNRSNGNAFAFCVPCRQAYGRRRYLRRKAERMT